MPVSEVNVSIVNQFESLNTFFKMCDENEQMSYEDFFEWTTGQLQLFLMVRGKILQLEAWLLLKQKI